MTQTTTTRHTYAADQGRRWEKGYRTVSVRAETIELAAQAAARKLYPGKRGALIAMRTTGDVGLSGYFLAYVPIGSEGGLTSCGDPFHVG